MQIGRGGINGNDSAPGHLPNFILMGAQKSGTTALYHALRQHPEIYMSSCKEPNFFLADDSIFTSDSDKYFPRIPNWERYFKLFSEVKKHKAIGEASVMYLSAYFPDRTAARIRERLPDVRLVAVLRHPADRAYSAYTFFVSRGIETLASFRDALDAEDQRISENVDKISSRVPPVLFYRRNGLYFEHLSKFLQYFPRKQMRLYLYEDWNDDPQRVLQDIYGFLGIRKDVDIRPLRRAVTGYTRSAIARKMIDLVPRLNFMLPSGWCFRLKDALKRANSARPPPLDRKIREELIDYFRHDILQLQSLIGRDLSHWLK